MRRIVLTLACAVAAAALLVATETTDDFSTDPSSRWTAQSGTYTWDSTNGEMDHDTASASLLMFRYNTPPGAEDLEHEAQVTFITGPDEFSARTATPMVRHPSGASTGYFLRWHTEEDVVQLLRYNAGSESDVEDARWAMTLDDATWYTVRIAAEGGEGDPVTISIWYQNHGSSKPSDPGWIGNDEAPDQVFVDTDSNRLDDATHIYCGIAGRNQTDYDTRHDYYKQRLIADRDGGGDPGGGDPGEPSGTCRRLLMGFGRCE